MISARPPVESDREMLLRWRNRKEVRAVSLDTEPIEEDDHTIWFQRLLDERMGESAIVEFSGEPVGIVQLESLDVEANSSGWGCHLGDGAVPPGIGASLPVIALAVGFEGWRLRRMSAIVLATNTNMLGVHRRLGVPPEGILRQHIRRDDDSVVDLHQFGVLSGEWPSIRSALTKLLPTRFSEPLDALYAELHDSWRPPSR